MGRNGGEDLRTCQGHPRRHHTRTHSLIAAPAKDEDHANHDDDKETIMTAVISGIQGPVYQLVITVLIYSVMASN